MAFPTVASVDVMAAMGSSSTTTPVTFAAANAGDLLICFIASDSAALAHTWPSPWVVLKDESVSGAWASIAYLIASGGETGVNVTHVSEKSNAITIRISASSWHGTTPPEITTAATGSSTTPDPGSITASWGSADNLFIATCEVDQSDPTEAVTAYPTNYTGDNTESHLSTSAGSLGIATRQLTGATDNPGTFTLNITETWNAYTLVVRPSAGGGSITPAALALTLALPAPQLNQLVTIDVLALTLGLPAPTISNTGLGIQPTSLALTLTPNAPAFIISQSITMTALPLGIGFPAPQLKNALAPALIPLTMGFPAPTLGVGAPPAALVIMHRLHRIQYHGLIFSPDANGGPGAAKMELTPDMLNLVWNQALNGAGQAALTLTRFNPKIASLGFMQDHIKIYRETSAGVKVVFAGKLVKPSEGTRDVIIYAWDYMAFLQRSRTGFKVLYPQKLIGTEIVQPEWTLAKSVADSPFAFVTSGTFEDPLGLDDVTPIKTNEQFGVSDFDRLFTFYALSELSMANTSHSVVFEITREPPHTFNFWANKGTPQPTAWHVEYPGNVVDYDLNTGQDEITNDIATPIIDPTTGQQVEYVVTDPTSIATYRRLQAALTIKTLYGITSGTTETDQQKAAAARLLTQSVVTPKLLVVFPRQGELEPFVGWDLGDSFRAVLRKADRAGDRLDTSMRAVGIGGSWTPAAGELLQVYLR